PLDTLPWTNSTGVPEPPLSRMWIPAREVFTLLDVRLIDSILPKFTPSGKVEASVARAQVRDDAVPDSRRHADLEMSVGHALLLGVRRLLRCRPALGELIARGDALLEQHAVTVGGAGRTAQAVGLVGSGRIGAQRIAVQDVERLEPRIESAGGKTC